MINECHVICQIRAQNGGDDVFFPALLCCNQSTPNRPCICIGGKSPSHMAVIGMLLKLLL